MAKSNMSCHISTGRRSIGASIGRGDAGCVGVMRGLGVGEQEQDRRYVGGIYLGVDEQEKDRGLAPAHTTLYIQCTGSPYMPLSTSPGREPDKERANQTYDQTHTTTEYVRSVYLRKDWERKYQ